MNNQPRNDKKSQLNKKKTRLYDSRNIKAQNNDASYDQKDTKLNVPEFLQSRKYEINAFELSQLKSKQALNSRCFQNLPRLMRRRAASHHISRIPKRLRAKALREMKGANAPSRKVARGRNLYKLLQRQKLLKVASRMKKERCTPGEIWTKCNIRAKHKEISKTLDQRWTPLEKKLNNSVGSFDHTAVGFRALPPPISIRYGKRQLKFSWIPTHIWHAKRFKMSKRCHFQIPYTPTQKCFRLMNRQNKYKAVCFDTSYRGTLSLTWTRDTAVPYFVGTLLNRTIAPSSILTGKRSYNGLIYIRKEPVAFGCIYLSLESKVMFIQVQTDNYEKLVDSLKFFILRDWPGIELTDCRYSLGSIDLLGPLSLQYLSKVLHLRDPSEELKTVWASLSSHSDNSLIPVGTTLSFEIYDPRLWTRPTKFPIKNEQDIYDTVMLLNNKCVADPKTLKSLFSPEGRYASYENQLSIKELGRIQSHGTPFEKVLHSTIPLLLTKTEAQTWSLICPWYWTLPIWIQLVKIPGIKAGGLKQIYQFNFENNKPTYPYDYAWTDDGQKYNCMIGDLSRGTDAKKPKKYISLQKSEDRFSTLYDAYTCDWHNLKCAIYTLQRMEEAKRNSSGSPAIANSFATKVAHAVYANKIQDKHKSILSVVRPSEFRKDRFLLEAEDGDLLLKMLPIALISLKTIGEGVIENNARIYEKNICKDEYVVGFVTTGGLNLNEGKFTGIGGVFLTPHLLKNPKNPLYVRNPGKELMYACQYRFIEQ